MNILNHTSPAEDHTRLNQLVHAVRRRAPLDAVTLLERENNETISAVIQQVDHELALRLLSHLPTEITEELASILEATIGEQWSLNLNYAEDSVGRLMEPLPPTFSPETSVEDAVEQLREIAKKQNIIYAFAVNDEMKLEGVIVMRDLLLANPGEKLVDVMVSEPFYLNVDQTVTEVMDAVIMRHYPIYPVCDDTGTLMGFVHGYALFENVIFS